MTWVVLFLALSSSGLAAPAPDGSTGEQRPCGRIVYQAHRSGTSTLRARKASGGAVRTLARGEYPGLTASPDGSLFVYEIYDAGQTDLWMVASDGTEPRRLTDTEGRSELEVDWSPDGGTLAFSSYDTTARAFEVVTLDLATGGTDSWGVGSEPSFSRGGERIAIAAPSPAPGDLTSDIYVISLRDGTRRTVSQDPSSHDASPEWSPDGRWIAFNRYPLAQHNENEGPYSDLWKVRPKGSPPVQLTEMQSDYVGVSPAVWSPDSRYIAFNSEHDSGGAVEIISADGRRSTGPLTRSFNHPSRRPTWSPRGTMISFERYGQTSDLWAYRLADRDSWAITDSERVEETYPLWVTCRG